MRVNSTHLDKGPYYAKMTRTAWRDCLKFQLRLEQLTATFAPPLLLGVCGTESAAHDSQQGTKTWDTDLNTYMRRRWATSSRSEQGSANELPFGTRYTRKQVEVTSTVFDAAQLYELLEMDPLDPEGSGLGIAPERLRVPDARRPARQSPTAPARQAPTPLRARP